MAFDQYDPGVQALLAPGTKDINPQAYDWSSPTARDVELSRLAYLHAELIGAERQRLASALATFNFELLGTAASPATGAYAFCALNESQQSAVISFRGTEPTDIRDVGTNLLALPSRWGGGEAMVHAGFALAFDSVRNEVARWMAGFQANAQVSFVGHSLGAALATLAGTLYPLARVTTIGAPRIGNAAFLELIPPGQLTRIVGCADLVPTLPPDGLFGYRHPATCTYVDCTGQLHANPSADFMANDQQDGRAMYQARYPLRPDYLPLRDLADHSPINYLNAYRRPA